MRHFSKPVVAFIQNDEAEWHDYPFIKHLSEFVQVVFKHTLPEEMDKEIDGCVLISPNSNKESLLMDHLINDQHVAIIEMAMIHQQENREHFLTKLFSLAHFRSVQETPSIQSLIQFQSENKYLLMAYDQQRQKELGRMVAKGNNRDIHNVYLAYKEVFYKLLGQAPSVGANINVLSHIMGYFSEQLSRDEKEQFLSLLEDYRKRQVPLSDPLKVLNRWVHQYDQKYLLMQTFLQPYPEGLRS
ncbi:YbgA family protein [Bacillus horti]|uniref:Uncharacterized protein YbgA (DUF1722 family) n=1 Tax=Caldalkalibacillus horti TaxID=77523 RepID=A0ABT9VVG4_9BACI|nr:YbgA family protein [Bacillus horti]MDQ0164869.1 uncharacterized protein YbgA (DUF1722 family) [Bacillus horti]